MIFFASFVLLAFKSRIRCKINGLIFLLSIIMVSSVAVSCLVFTFDAKYPNYGKVAIVVWLALAVGILALIVENSLTQILFVIFVSVNMYNNLAAIALMISELLPFRWPDAFGLFVIDSILLILFAPLNWLLMIKLYKNVVKFDIPVSKFLWTLPVMLYVVFLLEFVGDYWKVPQAITFSDLVGMVLWSVSTYVVFCIITGVILQIHNSVKMQEQAALLEKQLQMQNAQYYRLSENIKATAKMRHDFRHHLLTINGFVENENTTALREYLGHYSKSYYARDNASVCQNAAVDIVLHHYLARAEEAGIEVTLKADVPEAMPVRDMDLCVVFGNLFENAVEACERQKNGRKFISLFAKPDGNQLLIELQNSFESVVKKNGRIFSSKREGEGLGLQSVLEITERYEGVFKTDMCDNVFTASVLINF